MKASRGFTLVELIMVMVVIGVLAYMSAASISSYKFQYLNAAAERMITDLNYAKNMALTANKWTGAVFLVSPTNTYNIYTTDGVTDTNIGSPQDPGKNFIVNVETEYPGIIISAVNIASSNKIEYSPTGIPWNDKTGSALAADGTITLSSGSSTVTITITAGTGRAYK